MSEEKNKVWKYTNSRMFKNKEILFIFLLFSVILIFLGVFMKQGEAYEIVKGKIVVKDQTIEAIQHAIDFAATRATSKKRITVHIPEGTYKIPSVEDRRIHLKSNVNIELDEKAILIVHLPYGTSNYEVMIADNIENVTISGGQLKGDRHNHGPNRATTSGVVPHILDKRGPWGTDYVRPDETEQPAAEEFPTDTEMKDGGEWGYGIAVYGSKNINITNVEISEMWGDGIHISSNNRGNGKVPSENISISHVEIYDIRRVGIVIADAKGVLIEKVFIRDIKGVLPAAGIDIEPDWTWQSVENIVIKDVVTENTHGSGIDIAIFGGWEVDNRNYVVEVPVTVKIINHLDRGGWNGLRLILNNQAKAVGEIIVTDFDYESRNSGIHVGNFGVQYAAKTDIRFENGKTLNSRHSVFLWGDRNYSNLTFLNNNLHRSVEQGM